MSIVYALLPIFSRSFLPFSLVTIVLLFVLFSSGILVAALCM